jgi:multiple sugar transport system ATP-binding protein
MDEPLSNLDAKLRVQMRADVAALQAEFGITTVYVTHDQSEAMTLGHRVAVLHEGRLQQCDTPRALYDRPVNTFVAGFIGSPAMSFCTLPVGSNGSVVLGNASVALPAPGAAAIGARGLRSVVVGLRPEALEVAAEGIGARVEVVEELGADSYVFCASEVGGAETRLTARTGAKRTPQRGDRITLRPVAGEVHFFDPETGERLPD